MGGGPPIGVSDITADPAEGGFVVGGRDDERKIGGGGTVYGTTRGKGGGEKRGEQLIPQDVLALSIVGEVDVVVGVGGEGGGWGPIVGGSEAGNGAEVSVGPFFQFSWYETVYAAPPKSSSVALEGTWGVVVGEGTDGGGAPLLLFPLSPFYFFLHFLGPVRLTRCIIW